MPVYEFFCSKCEKTFELIQRVDEYDPGRTRCTHCGSKKVERRWSRVFAVTSKKS